MRRIQSIQKLAIMVTVLVTFAMTKSDVRGQNICFGTCPQGVNQTFSHADNYNADCGSDANGGCSFTAGNNNEANGDASMAFNSNNFANADNSFVIGDENTADGLSSFVGGTNSSTHTSAEYSFAYGGDVHVNRPYSTAIGRNLTQDGIGSFMAGQGYLNNTDYSLMVGWKNQTTFTQAPIMYVDLNDPAGDGFLGLNRTAVVNTSVNIDLSLRADAEKGAGGTTWTSPSDRRLKQDIQPFEDGLDVLMQFDPVSFRYNGKLGLPTDQEEVGVIAQDVKEFAPYMISGEEGEDSYLSYNSNALFYVLINSVQEQQEKIKDYEERINELEKQMAEFKEATSSTTNTSNSGSDGAMKEVTLSNISMEEPMLFQNEPNPFAGATTIRYFVPEEVANAEIIIVSTENGQLLKRVAIAQSGMGQLKVNIEKVAAGNYSYSLILDGKQALSKQMVVSH